MCRYEERLVAEASGDCDLVAALGTATAEDGLTGLGLHAGEEAVRLGAAAAVRLKSALRHAVTSPALSVQSSPSGEKSSSAELEKCFVLSGEPEWKHPASTNAQR